MNAEQDSFDFEPLEQQLATAVQEIANTPLSEDAITRVTARARMLQSPPKARAMPRRWPRLTWLAASAAAALLVALVLALSPRSAALADIVAAISQKPWLHAQGTGPDGRPVEIWFSPSEGILSFRSGDSFVLVDRELRAMDVFGPPGNSESIERFALENVNSTGLDASKEAFLGLLSGDPAKAIRQPGGVVLEHESKPVRVDGRELVEHRFVVGSENAGLVRTENLLRVDPDTDLPISWQQRIGNQALFDLRVSYPQTGPLTIVALGVPESTPVVDRTPTAELEQLLATLRAARRRFDDYHAVVIQSLSRDRDRGGELGYQIWRKGGRWRIDQFRLNVNSTAGAPPGVEIDAWWQGQAGTMKSYVREIWDGKQLWTFSPIYTQPQQSDPDDPDFLLIESLSRLARTAEPDHPQSSSQCVPLPEFWAYEPLDRFTMGFRSESQSVERDGTPMTIVDIVPTWNVSPKSVALRRYWLDPRQGDMITRKESFREANESEPVAQSEVTDSARTPKGLWYPLTIRRIDNTVSLDDRARSDSFVRYYLEFDVDIPEELFDATAVDTAKVWTKLP